MDNAKKTNLRCTPLMEYSAWGAFDENGELVTVRMTREILFAIGWTSDAIKPVTVTITSEVKKAMGR